MLATFKALRVNLQQNSYKTLKASKLDTLLSTLLSVNSHITFDLSFNIKTQNDYNDLMNVCGTDKLPCQLGTNYNHRA